MLRLILFRRFSALQRVFLFLCMYGLVEQGISSGLNDIYLFTASCIEEIEEFVTQNQSDDNFNKQSNNVQNKFRKLVDSMKDVVIPYMMAYINRRCNIDFPRYEKIKSDLNSYCIGCYNTFHENTLDKCKVVFNCDKEIVQELYISSLKCMLMDNSINSNKLKNALLRLEFDNIKKEYDSYRNKLLTLNNDISNISEELINKLETRHKELVKKISKLYFSIEKYIPDSHNVDMVQFDNMFFNMLECCGFVAKCRFVYSEGNIIPTRSSKHLSVNSITQRFYNILSLFCNDLCTGLSLEEGYSVSPCFLLDDVIENSEIYLIAKKYKDIRKLHTYLPFDINECLEKNCYKDDLLKFFRACMDFVAMCEKEYKKIMKFHKKIRILRELESVNNRLSASYSQEQDNNLVRNQYANTIIVNDNKNKFTTSITRLKSLQNQKLQKLLESDIICDINNFVKLNEVFNFVFKEKENTKKNYLYDFVLYVINKGYSITLSHEEAKQDIANKVITSKECINDIEKFFYQQDFGALSNIICDVYNGIEKISKGLQDDNIDSDLLLYMFLTNVYDSARVNNREYDYELLLDHFKKKKAELEEKEDDQLEKLDMFCCKWKILNNVVDQYQLVEKNVIKAINALRSTSNTKDNRNIGTKLNIANNTFSELTYNILINPLHISDLQNLADICGDYIIEDDIVSDMLYDICTLYDNLRYYEDNNGSTRVLNTIEVKQDILLSYINDTYINNKNNNKYDSKSNNTDLLSLINGKEIDQTELLHVYDHYSYHRAFADKLFGLRKYIGMMCNFHNTLDMDDVIE